jgi:hypothetical protein
MSPLLIGGCLLLLSHKRFFMETMSENCESVIRLAIPCLHVTAEADLSDHSLHVVGCFI